MEVLFSLIKSDLLAKNHPIYLLFYYFCNMKEIRRLSILVVVAGFCPLTMQAQEVKSVSLDSIPKASLPKEEMSLEYSQPTDYSLPMEYARPSLGGFPVLQGNPYYSESKEPWMSEDGSPLKIAPDAIPHYVVPTSSFGPFAAYSSSLEVPGLMNKQSAGLVYQQNVGRFVFSPYIGIDKVNTGVYGFGNLTKASFGGTMSYQVNDWLTVGLYGQYVPTKTSDPRSVIISPFNPKSNYGGFVEVMFNQHWGVGAKMGREFAPQKNGKWGWKNTTEIYPIYRK